MSTKVHDDREINNHEVKEIKFALTKVGVTRSGKSRGWESGSRDGTVLYRMHAVKIQVVL
jgi:hypothetical protein